MDIIGALNTHLMRPPAVTGMRLPTFYPSAAACIDQTDNTKIIGSCLRSQWYRCKGYVEDNPPGLYSQYIFTQGNLLEKWFNDKLKEMGLWAGNSIRFAIPDYYVSGEIDILIREPDGTLAIVENKTYSSSNYQAKKSLCGSRETKPKAKDQNVLQAFLYLNYFSKPENGGVSRVYLTYLDRAAGGPENNKQFMITIHEENGNQYPKISTTDFFGNYCETIDRRITMASIMDRYSDLMESLQIDEPPAPNYQHSYTAETVEIKFVDGEIAKTNYEKFKTNPDKYPVGDWNCSWCGYKQTCKAQKDLDGHR